MVLGLARNWWALALRGLFAIIFGLMALFWPGLTLQTLVLIFGAYVTVDGITAAIAAVRGRETHRQWVFLLLVGVIGVVAGLVALGFPEMTLLTLVYLAAAWAMVIGVLQIIAAIQLRGEIDNDWLLVLSGGVSLVLGGCWSCTRASRW